jgi:hypothetical protein
MPIGTGVFGFLLLCNCYLMYKHARTHLQKKSSCIDTRGAILQTCMVGVLVRIVSLQSDMLFPIVDQTLLPRFTDGTDSRWILFPVAQGFWFAALVLLFLFWGALAKATATLKKAEGLKVLLPRSSLVVFSCLIPVVIMYTMYQIDPHNFRFMSYTVIIVIIVYLAAIIYYGAIHAQKLQQTFKKMFSIQGKMGNKVNDSSKHLQFIERVRWSSNRCGCFTSVCVAHCVRGPV